MRDWTGDQNCSLKSGGGAIAALISACVVVALPGPTKEEIVVVDKKYKLVVGVKDIIFFSKSLKHAIFIINKTIFFKA